ncbi:MAG: phospholipase D family protein, partial [Candidatus Woesearchaeota archaeon]
MADCQDREGWGGGGLNLLVKPKDLEREFNRLMNRYSQFYWLSAWASVGFSCFETLKLNKHKIRKLIIGTSLNQTHPEFIREFKNNRNVKFMGQKQGIFHPKIYLFKNNKNDWEVLIGSLNFTSAAFIRNRESLLLLSHNSDRKNELYEAVLRLIDETWEEAEYFDNKRLKEYTKKWRSRPKVDYDLQASSYKESNSGFRANLTWKEFVQKVKREKSYSHKCRLNILEIANRRFKENKHFRDMADNERQELAGAAGIIGDIDWGLFGTTGGSGYFSHALKKNYLNISRALDQIPLNGEITKSHYSSFLKYFKTISPHVELAGMSRLLSMKRPDVFVSLNGKNRARLCEAFGIKHKH